MPTLAYDPECTLLTNDEAAKLLRLSPQTLNKYRVMGKGPRFRKLGRRVMYALVDLQTWIDEGQRSSTSDLGR